MIIKKLSFLNVRKISLFSEQFSPETNIIIGLNGSGKTSILESLVFLITGKSFRKKHTQSIIKKEKQELQIKGIFQYEEDLTIKLIYDGKKKQIFKNNQILKRTTELIKDNAIIYISPEETDIIEEYKKEKQQYFDKIIFRINPQHIYNIKEYNKLLLYRNSLLENNMSTKPWEEPLSLVGLKIWNTRNSFFDFFCKTFNETQKKLDLQLKYVIEYKNQEYQSKEEYIKKLQSKTKTNKTEVGPHKDIINLYLNNETIKEHASQGEKKLFKYVLKFTEAEIIKTKTRKTPIILLDDFFAKLDNENIMKIFSYFHRKFQVIITTTNTNDQTLQNIQKNNTNIKIFNNDKIINSN